MQKEDDILAVRLLNLKNIETKIAKGTCFVKKGHKMRINQEGLAVEIPLSPTQIIRLEIEAKVLRHILNDEEIPLEFIRKVQASNVDWRQYSRLESCIKDKRGIGRGYPSGY